MKLTVGERLSILQILPAEGDFTLLKVLRDLQSVIGLADEEHKKFDVKTQGTQVTWNPEGNKEKEIEIGERAYDLIVETLKGLNEKKKLSRNLFTVYEKFVEGKTEEEPKKKK